MIAPMSALGPIQTWLPRIIREPLVQFFALGGAAFVLHGAVAAAPVADGQRLHVSRDAIAATVTAFEAERGRGPTPDELQALIDERVERAALFAEASRLGLDQGDPIVHRRMVQKMRFVLEAQARVPDPTETELRAFRDAHAERFRVGDRLDFVHVFIDQRGAQPSDHPAELAVEHLAALRSGADFVSRGDPFLHGSAFSGQTAAAISRSFGGDFSAAVMRAPIDAWTVMSSSYGWHVVRVDKRVPGQLRPVADIEGQLEQQWRVAQQRDAVAQGLRAMRERYEVTIDDEALADARRVAEEASE